MKELSIKNGLSPNTVTNILMIAWLITLPFGSNIGAVSLGILTVYPNLVITLLLFCYVPFTFLKWNSIMKIIFLFNLLWLGFAIIWVVKYGKNDDAIFDIRSLMMQLIFSGVLFSLNSKLKWEQVKNNFSVGFTCFLVVLLVFGWLEFYTGNHFSGALTVKLSNLTPQNMHYAPAFIYDNQNDFLVYLLMLFLFTKFFNNKFQENLSAQLIVLFSLLIFSLYADSRIMLRVAIIVILITVLRHMTVKQFVKNAFTLHLPKLIMVSVALCFSIVLIIKKPITLGPKYQNPKVFAAKGLVTVTKKEGKFVLKPLDSLYSKAQIDSISEHSLLVRLDSYGTRMNFINNGIDFIKKHPIVGIGPGQYKTLHRQAKVVYPTGSNISAHNFPIEIISQYGIFGWGYFGILLYFFIQIVKRRKEFSIWILLSIPLFLIISVIPSSFLYLDLLWMFAPLLCILLEDKNRTVALPV
jgi:hypothetical protein